MLTEFEQRIAGFIKDNDLFAGAEKILLAISGGADSTALLNSIWTLKANGVIGAELVCAHINHQLRGPLADADEEFVISQACTLNLPVMTRRVDVRGFVRRNKLSIETAARKLRIETLLDIAGKNDCELIATAHHKDDNAETVLQRLSRGTGFRGLAGIWPKRAFAGGICFVRPLLCARREEIINYLKQRNLKWRTDHTNEDCRYRRNFIRHHLMPVLQKECSGPLVEQLYLLSQSARRFYGLICSHAENAWREAADCRGNTVAINLQNFSSQPKPIKIELIRKSLASLGSGEGNFTRQHYKKITYLAKQGISKKKLELPGGFLVWREYRKLVFAQSEEAPEPARPVDKIVELKVPGLTRFGNYLVEAKVLDADGDKFEKFKAGKSNFVERFDADKVARPLVIRSRQAGDRFRPLGLGEEKRVGKFLTDAHLPQDMREQIFIFAGGEKIIWVAPIRISEEARVTEQTQRILQLKITEA